MEIGPLVPGFALWMSERWGCHWPNPERGCSSHCCGVRDIGVPPCPEAPTTPGPVWDSVDLWQTITHSFVINPNLHFGPEAVEHYLLFTFAGWGLSSRDINPYTQGEGKQVSKVRRQLHWKPCKPLTAVKVTAGLKDVNSKNHKPPPLLHFCSLTELETKRIYFFKRHFRALLWGLQIITLCREHNSGTKLFLCSVWAPKGFYHTTSFQHSWRTHSNTPGEGFPTM